jgi:hypothetical protein
MPAYLTNYVYALGQEMRPKSAAGTRALRPPPPVSAPTPVVQGLSRRSHLTAETRWTQRGKAATETADYGIRGRRETNRAVFCVFRGSYPQGNCSQPANNLDYCSAVQRFPTGVFSPQPSRLCGSMVRAPTNRRRPSGTLPPPSLGRKGGRSPILRPPSCHEPSVPGRMKPATLGVVIPAPSSCGRTARRACWRAAKVRCWFAITFLERGWRSASSL